VDHSACVCNKEQLYALVDTEVRILIYSLFQKYLGLASQLNRSFFSQFILKFKVQFVDVGCCPNHTPERALDARAATDRRTQRGYHSYVVKHREVYKKTTKG
jgi:hypothetical protein